MPAFRMLRWPQRAGYAAIALLTATGAVTLFLLVLEIHSPVWSRPALALQVLAVGCALLLTYRYQPPRFFLYPLVLAAAIYLWDTTLPPPSLPDGPLRRLIPYAVLVGLLVDMLTSVRRPAPRRPRNATRIYGGYIELDGCARVLDTTVVDLRTRLRRTGRSTLVSKSGVELLSLDDLLAVLASWNVDADHARRNGVVCTDE